ncbi:hypothetical protein FRC11_009255, partial [Ceratobasidium sp. 423]
MDGTAGRNLGSIPRDLIRVAKGGPCEVYRYQLRDGTIVAVKAPRQDVGVEEGWDPITLE